MESQAVQGFIWLMVATTILTTQKIATKSIYFFHNGVFHGIEPLVAAV